MRCLPLVIPELVPRVADQYHGPRPLPRLLDPSCNGFTFPAVSHAKICGSRQITVPGGMVLSKQMPGGLLTHRAIYGEGICVPPFV